MIAFACVTTDERAFRAGAAQTIERVSENSSLLLRRHRRDSLDEALNEMLVEAAGQGDLEAVALLRQDVHVGATDRLARVRALLAASPDVAVIGTTSEWAADPSRASREVELVDGTLFVLSAWAARELRFDPDAGGSLDACAMDVCLQARAAGRRVIATDLRATLVEPLEQPADRSAGLRAAVAVRRRWAVETMRLFP